MFYTNKIPLFNLSLLIEDTTIFFSFKKAETKLRVFPYTQLYLTVFFIEIIIFLKTASNNAHKKRHTDREPV